MKDEISTITCYSPQDVVDKISSSTDDKTPLFIGNNFNYN